MHIWTFGHLDIAPPRRALERFTPQQTWLPHAAAGVRTENKCGASSEIYFMQSTDATSSESRWVHIVHCTTSVMQQYGAEKMTSVNLPKRRLSANFMKIQIGGAGTSLDKKWQKCLTMPADMCVFAPLMDTNNQVSRVTPSS